MSKIEILMRTEVLKDGVRYSVLRNGDPYWSTFVRFGRTRANRAAGPAFQEACHEQESRALAAKEHEEREAGLAPVLP